MNVRLATGPVTWGVDFADAPTNPPWPHVLDEIADSGLGALELGPIGYLPTDPAALRQALNTRNLTVVGSFVFDDFHDLTKQDAIQSTTAQACRTIAGGGGQVLSLIDRPSPERSATAGRSAAARRLDTRGWRAMLDSFERAAAIAHTHELTPVIHPHAGGYVEFEDEIERLLDDTSLDLCLDTGHVAYAGMIAHDAITAYSQRISHVHLKDVNPQVLERVHIDKHDFWTAIDMGIFCPLGEGLVDLAAVLHALAEAGYAGYATIEQDRTPTSGAPLDELRRSITAIRMARSDAVDSTPR